MPRTTTPIPTEASTWALQDAKARFSEMVRDARERGPQRVTVHGKAAVVVVDIKEWERLVRPRSGRDLVEMLANSPLQDVEFERLSVRAPIRDVEL